MPDLLILSTELGLIKNVRGCVFSVFKYFICILRESPPGGGSLESVFHTYSIFSMGTQSSYSMSHVKNSAKLFQKNQSSYSHQKNIIDQLHYFNDCQR